MNNTRITAKQKKQIDTDGFLVLKNILTNDNASNIASHLDKLWNQETINAGIENDYREPGVKRLANLINKGQIFRPLYTHPKILHAMQIILGSNFKLEMVNAREPTIYSKGKPQELHCDINDTDRKNGGVPSSFGGFFIGTAVILLDDFTITNGCTSIVPGSHKFNTLPEYEMEDVYQKHEDEIPIEGNKGDVFILNGHCWHRGSANKNSVRRRSVLLHYKRIDVPSYHEKKHDVDLDTLKSLLPWEIDLVS